jgi:hypothetical protein
MLVNEQQLSIVLYRYWLLTKPNTSIRTANGHNVQSSSKLSCLQITGLMILFTVRWAFPVVHSHVLIQWGLEHISMTWDVIYHMSTTAHVLIFTKMHWYAS